MARRPDVDVNDVVTRYRTKKSEELAMIAELYDFLRANPISIRLVDLIGREPWFAKAVSSHIFRILFTANIYCSFVRQQGI